MAERVIKLAVMAVGGQGGGVLTGWIETLARQAGYAVQMTSVAGVAQRTGATIYYVEMAQKTDRAPVFSLAPAAGDVDVLVAAELMEAGRAVMRGFVTPDRTIVVASDHRVLAVDEKIVPSDGRGDGAAVLERVADAAKKLVCFDMERLAVEEGSMISASLFGGLAKSEALPFAAADFEAVIQAGGRGANASLRAFSAALNFEPENVEQAEAHEPTTDVPAALLETWKRLVVRVEKLPAPVRDMAFAGLRKTVDFQDPDYGARYLEKVEAQTAQDTDVTFDFAKEAAKYIANAMCYDDILKVADLKTRKSRQARLLHEQQAEDAEVVLVTEYFHPRAEEVCSTLPAGFGQWVSDRPRVLAWLDRRVNKGRRVRTDRLWWFVILWLIAGRKKRRLGSLRHRVESIHLERLTKAAETALAQDYKLGCEVWACQRLVKGYSDTHERGLSKFDRVIGALPLLEGREDAADWVRRLRTAALQDEAGDALDGAIETVRSL